MTTLALRLPDPSRPVLGTFDDETEFRAPIERVVCDAVPRGSSATAALTVECFDAFVDSGCDPESAARTMAARCVQFGETQAKHGLTDEELTTAVRAIGRGLRRHIIPSAVRELGLPDLEALSRAVQEYLLRIVGHIRQGMQTVQRFHALTPARRRSTLAAALFGTADERMLRALSIACGIDASVTLTPIVSVDPTVPLALELRRRDDVVAGPAASEALVPASWSSAQVAELAGTAVARGPAAGLLTTPESVRLARTTATIADPRTPVTESRDVLAQLLVAASPVLADLIVDVRLAPIADLPASRRNTLARTLLSWLEHGRPVNEVARIMGVPAQTVHTRLSTARRLLGDALSDPDGRLELLTALRAVLPRWEAEGATR